MLNTLLIFNNQEENFEEKVCIIMKITVFLLVNATKLYQFKAKNSAIKPYPLCLGNISKYLQSVIYIYIYKNGLVYNVSADYNNNGNSDIDSDIIDKA